MRQVLLGTGHYLRGGRLQKEEEQIKFYKQKGGACFSHAEGGCHIPKVTRKLITEVSDFCACSLGHVLVSIRSSLVFYQ